jgi:hypothetical protein
MAPKCLVKITSSGALATLHRAAIPLEPKRPPILSSNEPSAVSEVAALMWIASNTLSRSRLGADCSREKTGNDAEVNQITEDLFSSLYHTCNSHVVTCPRCDTFVRACPARGTYAREGKPDGRRS